MERKSGGCKKQARIEGVLEGVPEVIRKVKKIAKIQIQEY